MNILFIVSVLLSRNVAVSMYGMSAIVETNHSDVKTSKTENNNIKHKHAQKKIHQAKQVNKSSQSKVVRKLQ